MKITLFTHNAVIGVDAPLCHKSQSYIDDLITRGEAFMLQPGTFRRPAAKLLPPKVPVDSLNNETLMSAAHEASVSAALTAQDAERNVGIANTEGEVLRSKARMKAWMHPDTADSCAPLPRGAWADMSRLEVCATP